MQLKHLVINGFKSFADKTDIEFVSGLTGIVGPNGSGKSNITEAIRWTLGEQSAKSLRGEKMGDVIFAGTANRPPLNRAEVTMTFDNSDGYLKDQPATVSVTRRLYRDGEADFLINNRTVRLKDIVDLFMDSGLGKESFSFISQGRVEAIFNSKPEDRRGILEEAAGVLKYKQQKQKAERELTETADNLARVNDIISELKRQVEPLEEQASLARDFERQTKDYQSIHKQILALEIGQFAADQDQLQATAKMTKQTITALTAKIKDLEGQSETATATGEDLEQQLTAVNDDVLAKSMKMQGLTGDANVSAERANNAQQTLADLKTQLSQAKAQLATANTKVADTTKLVAAKQAEQATLAQQLATLQDASTTPATLNQAVEDAQNHYIDLLQQQATNKNAIAATEKDQQVATNQNEEQTRRLHDLKARLKEATSLRDQLKQTHDNQAAQLAAAQTALADAQAAATTANTAYREASTHYQAAVNDFQRQKSRYETLAELKDDYAGFFAGVRTVLQHKQQLPGVVGAVAELLTVPADYQQAFDIALGANLQAIVTTDEQAAKAAISYLKQQRAGRATFLPISVIRPRTLPGELVNQLRQMTGFIGVAIDLIDTTPQVQNVMASLMGTLIVADDLDHGIQLANAARHRYRIVTLAGDILNPGGAMTGGQSRHQASSPLARTQEVAQLKAQLKDLVPALQQEKQALDQLNAQLAAAVEASEAAQNTVNQQTADARANTAQLNSQTDVVTQLERQAEALRLAGASDTDYAAQLTQLNDEATTLVGQLTAAQQAIEASKTALAEATAAASDKQAAISKQETALAVLKTELATTKTQLQQWQDSAADNDQQAHDLAKRIDQITKAAAESNQDKATRQATIASLTKELKALKASQDELTKARGANREAISKLSAQITTAYEQQHQAMSDAEQQASDLSRVKVNLDNRLSVLAETYQLTYEAAAKDVTAKADELPALKSRLKLLKRGLDELGPINPNAIAEYDNVKERYEFLTKQQDDLLDAKHQLTDTMAELDEEVKTRFKDMFDQTNKAFQEIFPRMFGGGHAHLSLTDPDDLLNTGLEISAEPPGKKLQRLSLLSGGERALTAIVLLFAILQVRPVPFSILDEVEASLDDVNVNRFGEFLKHYASDTQFIVITHRRGTMLAANMLYGVTMQESGVSKMMAVSLDQVAQTEAK